MREFCLGNSKQRRTTRLYITANRIHANYGGSGASKSIGVRLALQRERWRIPDCRYKKPAPYRYLPLYTLLASLALAPSKNPIYVSS